MDISSFVLSLCAWFVMFVVLMLLFTWLSRKPGNAVVYYPSRILKGLEPWEGRSRNRHPFAWIQEALSSSEQDVIAMSGVDTAVYFVFLKTVLGILVLSGLVLLPVLLPVSATSVSPTNHDAKATKTSVSATKHDDTSSESLRVLNTFSMGNIGNNSDRLWAFLIAMYWVSFVTYYLLWKAYEHVSRLRADALMSLEVKPEQFAILVRDIPDGQGQTRKEQVELYFKTIYPDTYYRSIVITNNKKVNKIWKELEGYRKKLALAKAKNAESKSNDKPEGARPTKRTGFLGLFGKKVDIIEYYNEKINEIIPKLESEQKVTLQEKQQGAALVFFTSRLTAASAAQSLHARLVNNWTVIAAPEPRQLIWNNLKIKFFQRKVRQFVVSIIVPLIVSSLIPISLIYHLLGLEKLKIMDTTSLGDWLPQVAFYVILVLLRKLLAFLSKVEGIPSESHVVRAASGKYFYVIFLNIFIVAAATVTLDSGWKIRTKTDNPAVSWLGYILSSNAKFFMKFVALNIFLSYGPELLRLPTLILYHLKMKYWYKTEEQRKEACSPGGVDYGTRVPDNLLIFTIVQFYSITAPLIIPIGVAYFGVAWLVLRNQALKIYVPSYESYGRMWPHMHTRILTSLVLCQVTMLGSLGMRQFDYTPLLIPLPILSLLFGYTCSEKFYRFYSDTALEVACHPLNKVPNMDQVFKAFIPPSLRSENIDDDQFADAS